MVNQMLTVLVFAIYLFLIVSENGETLSEEATLDIKRPRCFAEHGAEVLSRSGQVLGPPALTLPLREPYDFFEDFQTA